METIIINVAKEFSKTPGPRYEIEGKFSGEVFRKNILAPNMKRAISENKILKVNLDGTAGYGTSFIEESFGGLIREDRLLYADVKCYLRIISTEEDYLIEDIDENLKEANKMLKHAV